MAHTLCLFLFSIIFAGSLDIAVCQPSCRNLTLAVNALSITSSMQYDASDTLTTGNLLLNVSWEVSGSAPIDGFLLKVRSTRMTNIPPLRPLQPCVPGDSSLWISDPECQNINNSSPECAGQHSSDNTSCICNATCSTYQNIMAQTCKGTLAKLTEGFVSLNKNIRWATFNAKFHESYQADLHAYFREFIAPRSAVIARNTSNLDCPSLISSYNNQTLLQAVASCCEINVTHLRPLNVREMTSVNLTSATLTLTISWLPPGLQENLEILLFRIRIVNQIQTIPFIGVKVVENPEVPTELMIPCYNTTYGQKVVIPGLLPGYNYSYSIRPIYDRPTTSRYCANGNCEERGIVYYQNTSLCNPVFNACDNSSQCFENGTQYYCRRITTTTQEISTTAPSTTKISTNIPTCNLNCVSEATCMGDLCVCPSTRRGDGIVGGTGCSAGTRTTPFMIAVFLQSFLVFILLDF